MSKTYDDLKQIYHDSFGRWALLRLTVSKDQHKSCKWCGNPKGRFIYFTKNDSIGSHLNQIEGNFCSIGCMRDYHRDLRKG